MADWDRGAELPKHAVRLVILAMDEGGYANLCQLLSKAHTRGKKGEAWAYPEELRDFAPGLVALCDCPRLLPALHEAYADRLYARCARHLQAEEKGREAMLREVAAALGVRAVACPEVLYHQRDRRSLQDVMVCIRHGVPLQKAGCHLCSNGEHALLGPREIARRYADAPVMLSATREIAERCTFSLDALRYRYPEESLPRGETEESWLRVLTFQGARVRYPEGIPEEVRTQLEAELDIIGRLEYGGYFLTMYEIVEFCRAQKILCQGRGSAANSAVCYCLGVTAVDPDRIELLFERFLSLERAEPPDIDLDIEHERREEVIQHVYEKYGRRHAAMVSNVVRYRPRSAIREVGKALGIPLTDVDAIARLLSHWGGEVPPDIVLQAGLNPSSPAMKHLLRVVGEMLDSPRHQSIHPGGFLLGHKPVDHLVPIEPATMEGRTVIQWDKYDVENLGLFKVDLLGLGALTCLRKAFHLLKEHEGKDYKLRKLPPKDKKTYDLCCAGDTVGVFQIESRAQMAMLPRLQPREFYDLVIQVAIVRPGPIQGDMVHPFLKRRHGKEEVEYPHDDLRPVLQRTLGVPIFQEQVMKLAVVVAGYTPGEADQLRRDMAAWRSAGKIEQHRDKMIPNMIAHGVDPEFAKRVFDQVCGFGEYGFPESHAASFALLAYATAYVRAHYPAVFSCALLNSQPMGFYSPATLIEDAKRKGVAVRPVCVQHSAWDHTLARGEAGDLQLQVGLRLVRHLGERERSAIEQARHVVLDQVPAGVLCEEDVVEGAPEGGLASSGDGDGGSVILKRPFADLDDFVRRTRLGERPLISLAEAGAFEVFGIGRRDALWQLRSLIRARDDSLPETAATSQLGFAQLRAEDAVLWDYRASGHSARGHPMTRYRAVLRSRRVPTAAELARMPHGARTQYVGQVICRQRPQTASGVTFFTLEDETGFVNLVVWARLFEQHNVFARTAVLLGVHGEVQKAEDAPQELDSSGSHGTVHLVAHQLFAPDLKAVVQARSRDFH